MYQKWLRLELLWEGAQSARLWAFAARVKVELGVYYKAPCLWFCGIVILNPPPERLPVGMTPWSPPGMVVMNLQMCVCHAPLQRLVPQQFLFLRLRRLPLSRTEFNCSGLRPRSDPGKPAATRSLILEMENARQQNQQGPRAAESLGVEGGVGGEH